MLGENGPIQIDIKNPAPISVSSAGEISQGAESRGRLKLTTFNDPKLLSQASGGVYVADDPHLVPTKATGASVRQGWIEGSNVVSVIEMANLMTAMRTFEANQRIIQIQDERMGKTISEMSGS